LPITPLHAGPGLLLKAACPNLSLLTFLAVQVFIDVEPLYYLMTDDLPLHRFTHTALGATTVGFLTVLCMMALRHVPRIHTMLAGTGELETVSLCLGALTGAGSHVVLDSIMHWDVGILAPLSETNSLFGLIEWASVNWVCIGAGVVGAGLLSYRGTYRNLMHSLNGHERMR
jgi:membrane-bound metal-dependent hydrolase YbcI (DUF457 family)